MCFNGYIGRLPISRLCLSMTSADPCHASRKGNWRWKTVVHGWSDRFWQVLTASGRLAWHGSAGTQPMCFNGYIGRLPISRLCLSMTSVPANRLSQCYFYRFKWKITGRTSGKPPQLEQKSSTSITVSASPSSYLSLETIKIALR
jgi:hypothetical protein